MPLITTYRTVKTLATAQDQAAIAAKLGEFLNDAVNTFGRAIIEIQTSAGHIYVHMDDAIPQNESFDPAYYAIEKVT
jgi:hypothetical protein